MIPTIANNEACSAECPNGSMCQATRGRYWEPNVFEMNLNPTTHTRLKQ